MDEEFEKELLATYEIIRKRLVELGIENQLPSLGVFRIIVESVMMNFGAEEDEEEAVSFSLEDLKATRIGIGDSNMGMIEVNGEKAEALCAFHDASNNILVLGFIHRTEGCVYIKGHKVSVDFESKLRSYHMDGSECYVPCRHCHEPNVYVIYEAGEYYAECQTCLYATDLYPDKYMAIGAWIVGKVEKEPEL